MKRILTALLCLTVAFVLCVNAYAVERKYENMYSIDLPEEYYEIEEHKFIGDDDSTFSVTIDENTDGEYSVENLSRKELEENAKTLAESAKEAFESINEDGGMELVSVEKIKHPNGKTAAVTVYKTYMTDGKKNVSHLQKIYEFAGVNNKYTFIYTAEKDEDIDSLDDAFNSINIFEAEAESTFDKIVNTAALAGLVCLFLLGIFRFIRGRK